MLAIATGIPTGSVSLTQIMPSEIDHGLPSVGLNRSYSSIWWPPTPKPLRIGDRTFARGLGTRAPNAMTYRLDGRFQRFQAWVGPDVEVVDKPDVSIVFRILGDGKILFDSGPMRAKDGAKRVDVSVEGVQKLKLEADDPGKGSPWDHADWADPTVLGIQPRARISAAIAAYRVKGDSLEVLLDSKGHPCGLRLPGAGLKVAYPVGCQSGGPMLNFRHGPPWFSDDAPRISAGIPR